jgi:hypothetical protein
MEPDTYDGTIEDTTPTHTRKRKEEEWERLRTCWYIRKGFLKGVTANLRDAIDEQFYPQLKHRHTAYRNTTPLSTPRTPQLNMVPSRCTSKEETQGCLLGKCLDDDQTTLVRSDITISNENKLQFYLEQMYDSNMFDKAEMMDWEQQPINIKTNYPLAKLHFRMTRTSKTAAAARQDARSMKAPTTWPTSVTRSRTTL